MWTRPGGIVDQLVQLYGLEREESVARFLHDRQMPMGIGHPEDVAHALGRVKAGIGREVLCLIWWPDGARLTAKDLDSYVDTMIRDGLSLSNESSPSFSVRA